MVYFMATITLGSCISEQNSTFSRYIRIVGIDDVIYGKNVVGEEAMSEPWFVEEIDSSGNIENNTSTCSIDELPFSLIPTRPSTIKMCHYFYINPHASRSYVVMDESHLLWVWVNYGGVGFPGMVVICIIALLASPLLSWLIVKRIYH
jgi:hypothetical protein